MLNVYNKNGLVFWNEDEIREREHLTACFAAHMDQFLREQNAAFHLIRIEAPTLTPTTRINPNYTDDDVYFLKDGLAMRPETTPGSYAYARSLLDSYLDKPPFCVWQSGKSYRAENDQPLTQMRLKEFYQQEFQCLYVEGSNNNYMGGITPRLRNMFEVYLGRTARVVDSDRLPSYSLKTVDVEIELPNKWMEVCSISLRNDFHGTWTHKTNNGTSEKKLLNVEVAIGLDRCVYARFLDRK